MMYTRGITLLRKANPAVSPRNLGLREMDTNIHQGSSVLTLARRIERIRRNINEANGEMQAVLESLTSMRADNIKIDPTGKTGQGSKGSESAPKGEAKKKVTKPELLDVSEESLSGRKTLTRWLRSDKQERERQGYGSGEDEEVVPRELDLGEHKDETQEEEGTSTGEADEPKRFRYFSNCQDPDTFQTGSS